MKAKIVGDELLAGFTINTGSAAEEEGGAEGGAKSNSFVEETAEDKKSIWE